MLKLLGYHDAYASGVIHAIAGGFALGVLMVLGPELENSHQVVSQEILNQEIHGCNNWIISNLYWFLGFYAACNIPIFNLGPEYGMEGISYWTATNIYVTNNT